MRVLPQITNITPNWSFDPPLEIQGEPIYSDEYYTAEFGLYETTKIAVTGFDEPLECVVDVTNDVKA
ncbi:MAG: hypothetical protein A2X61_12115 [Ignavibacteria bacterium GWB2_35_12]|nr:MAG: hypothetical protein A2X61_12115 [Ignavibacteria bacterium GWB2_35_12]OGU90063.1 MAG: hypothetical protein A2220_04745 [Ignavibacteria bacterium RIFOXYA2_FULL_35_10]OGV19096.1 MAG: hypothetical protein A2475_00910 [Ignavibacteria bacterium RIFOXYC2_FULL_35_21]